MATRDEHSARQNANRQGQAQSVAMQTLGGKHKQVSGREITYWACYSELSSGEVAVCAVFTEPRWTTLGDVDLTLPPTEVPITLRVRSALLSYIEITEFGPGRQPPPEWIGWRGGIL